MTGKPLSETHPSLKSHWYYSVMGEPLHGVWFITDSEVERFTIDRVEHERLIKELKESHALEIVDAAEEAHHAGYKQGEKDALLRVKEALVDVYQRSLTEGAGWAVRQVAERLELELGLGEPEEESTGNNKYPNVSERKQ